jgi:uncharacterized integral membrane protein
MQKENSIFDSIDKEIKTLRTQLVVAYIFIVTLITLLLIQVFTNPIIVLEPISLIVGIIFLVIVIRRLKNKILFQKISKDFFKAIEEEK